jgi:hypothetical protein
MQELFCSSVLSLVMVRVLLLRVIDSFGGFFLLCTSLMSLSMVGCCWYVRDMNIIPLSKKKILPFLSGEKQHES